MGYSSSSSCGGAVGHCFHWKHFWQREGGQRRFVNSRRGGGGMKFVSALPMCKLAAAVMQLVPDCVLLLLAANQACVLPVNCQQQPLCRGPCCTVGASIPPHPHPRCSATLPRPLHTYCCCHDQFHTCETLPLSPSPLHALPLSRNNALILNVPP